MVSVRWTLIQTGYLSIFQNSDFPRASTVSEVCGAGNLQICPQAPQICVVSEYNPPRPVEDADDVQIDLIIHLDDEDVLPLGVGVHHGLHVVAVRLREGGLAHLWESLKLRGLGHNLVVK